MRVDLWADDFEFDSYVVGLVTLRPMTPLEAFNRFDAETKRHCAFAFFEPWNAAIKRGIRAGKLLIDRQARTIRRRG